MNKERTLVGCALSLSTVGTGTLAPATFVCSRGCDTAILSTVNGGEHV